MSTPKIKIVGIGYTQDQVDELLDSKADLKTFDNHEIRLSNIEQHLEPKYIVTDDATAHKKSVPANVCSNARINSIGGMTYKSDNLIPFPYKDGAYGEGFITTQSGATLTVRADGGIALSGTPTGYGALALWEIKDLSTIPEIITTSLQGIFTNAGMTLTVTFEDSTTQVIELTSSGNILKKSDYPAAKKFVFALKRNNNNVAMSGICYPMINPGETVLSWTPFFEGFRHSAVTELVSIGANLIPFPYTKAVGKHTSKGITYTINSDGSIHVKGTSDSSGTFTLVENKTIPLPANTSICLSGGIEGASVVVKNSDNNSLILSSSTTYKSKQLQEGELINYVGIYVDKGKTVDGTIYPMLNIGTTPALPYEPFKEPETVFQIPAEIQALPNYGKMFTELDLVNKKFVDRYIVDASDYFYWAIEYNGVEDWDTDPFSTVISITFGPSPVAPPIDVLGLVKTEKPYDSISFNGINFTLQKRVEGLRGHGQYTRDEYDALMGQGELDRLVNDCFGTITVIATNDYYFVTEHDISAYIDNNIIKVTAGGSIEFVNEHGQAVPSSITYMLKEV